MVGASLRLGVCLCRYCPGAHRQRALHDASLHMDEAVPAMRGQSAGLTVSAHAAHFSGTPTRDNDSLARHLLPEEARADCLFRYPLRRADCSHEARCPSVWRGCPV